MLYDRHDNLFGIEFLICKIAKESYVILTGAYCFK